MYDPLKMAVSAPICDEAIWLVDNGSLRADSVLRLRRRAAALSLRLGQAVEAVSVLHSAKIPPEQLENTPAAVFAPLLRQRAAAGLRRLTVLPYFFGPSAALTDYLPAQVEKIATAFPQLEVRIAAPLVDLATAQGRADERIAAGLERAVLAELAACNPAGAAVVLVDHGSPLEAVSAVRNHVGRQLNERLVRKARGKVRAFAVASMEAREGEAYGHTLPLFEQVLGAGAFAEGAVVVAPLFLSPGRHAGADGDLMQIACRAQSEHPALRVRFCPLAGEADALTDILAERFADCAQTLWRWPQSPR